MYIARPELTFLCDGGFNKISSGSLYVFSDMTAIIYVRINLQKTGGDIIVILLFIETSTQLL